MAMRVKIHKKYENPSKNHSSEFPCECKLTKTLKLDFEY